MVRMVWLGWMLLLGVRWGLGQADGVGQPGSVVGHVEFEETGLPARYAEVRLLPRPVETAAAVVEGVNAEADAQRRRTTVSMIGGETGLDGSFRLEGVPPGDYLVAAHIAGFVSPIGAPDWRVTLSAEETERLLRSVPSVHVGAGQVTQANVVMRRGGTISGRVEFADGSPAIAVPVQFEPEKLVFADSETAPSIPSAKQSSLLAVQSFSNNPGFAVTDDHGRFRLSGLSPGRYVVSAVVSSPTAKAHVAMEDGNAMPGATETGMPSSTTLYVPGTFRRREAKILSVRGAEELTGANLVINGDGLHAVSGRLVGGEDRHPLTGGMVRIREEKAEEPEHYAMADENGVFQVPYLLAGTYDFEVTGASDTVAADGETPPSARAYRPLKQTIVVGDRDLALQDVVMTAPKPGETLEPPAF